VIYCATKCIGADFYTAVVATAPGEKLLIRRRPGELDPATIFFFVSLRKSTKTAATRPALFDASMHQIVVGVCSAPPDLLAVFRGPTSKGRVEEGREGVLPLP